MDRVNGPFEEQWVRWFLQDIRSGTVINLLQNSRASGGVIEGKYLGWLQKESKERFVTTLSVYKCLNNINEAITAFLQAEPDYITHNANYLPMIDTLDLTSAIRESVQAIIKDPESGKMPAFERRKNDYWKGRMSASVLAGYALIAIGCPNHTSEASRTLAPIVKEAFEVFKTRRPDLEDAP